MYCHVDIALSKIYNANHRANIEIYVERRMVWGVQEKLDTSIASMGRGNRQA